MKMRRILIIDDDPILGQEVSRALHGEGFACDIAIDGETGLEMALTNPYDLVVLDIMVPRFNGYQICAQLRSRDLVVPILMLTAKGGEWDEAEALDTGADDYLVKPVSLVVLKAHVHALIRRAHLLPAPKVTWSDLTLDRSMRTCDDGAAMVHLTGREVEVLASLLNAQGEIVSKEELFSTIWGTGGAAEVDPNIIVVYVKRLREKFEIAMGRKIIETVHGVGYRVGEAA
jgi:DNA-binding response OmpR family regulator